jgi:hypothetical protein
MKQPINLQQLAPLFSIREKGTNTYLHWEQGTAYSLQLGSDGAAVFHDQQAHRVLNIVKVQYSSMVQLELVPLGAIEDAGYLETPSVLN